MKLATALSSFVFIGAAAAQDAHVHGAGYLSISADGSMLVTEFITDQHTLYGFEGEAATDEQRAVMTNVAAQLEASEALLDMQTSVTCAVASITVEEHTPDEGLGGHDDHEDHHDHDPHGHHDEHDGEEEHGDVMIRSVFTCDGSPSINSVNVTAFEQFPALEDVSVVVLTDRQQAEEMATRAQRTVRF